MSRLIPRAILLAIGFGLPLGIAIPGLAEERIKLLFLGGRGPIVLDVTIDAGARSVTEIRREYALGVLRRLDRDGDGRLTPAEAQTIPKSGRTQADAETLGEDWRKLDLNSDGLLSADEVTEHIQSALGPALAVEKAPPRRAQTARLSVDLDLNKDGRITREEMENGLEQLRRLDFDDDDALSVAELQPFPRSIVEARRQQERQESESPLLPLGTAEELRAAAERCAVWYGNDQGSTPRELLPDIPDHLFRAFDRDRNGSWNAAEFEQHLRRGQGAVALTARLPKSWIDLEKGVGESGRKPTLDLGGVPVEFTAADRQWMRLDAVALYKINFRRSDADKNGYLDQAEFTGLQSDSAFEAVDLDGNDQVTLSEVQDFFTLDVLAQQSRLLILLSDETQSLFDLLDPTDPATLTRDFRLSPRDLRLAADRLLTQDLNGNGALEQGELLQKFQIRFTRPELFDTRPMPNEAMAQQGRGQTDIGRRDSGPLWFTRMDRNLDAEISWREFLGPRTAFEQLDKDGDGFIIEEEAQAAERLRNADVTP